MDDKELAEKVATGLGWWKRGGTLGADWVDADDKWIAPAVRLGDTPVFSPATSDADCMMAWDKVTEMDLRNIPVGEFISIFGRKTDADRRKATCECIIKATE